MSQGNGIEKGQDVVSFFDLNLYDFFLNLQYLYSRTIALIMLDDMEQCGRWTCNIDEISNFCSILNLYNFKNDTYLQ